MAEWHTIELNELDRLSEVIESIVEMLSDYGRQAPDWERVIDEVERSEDSLDLGANILSPVIKAILRKARKIYRELQDEAGP